MSSSNQVRVVAIPEVTYGVTPGAGNFKTARFISEGLSGTPNTVVSQQIRTDRQPSGQIVTGLTVGGELAFELAKEDQIESFMESAMYSTWDVKAQTTVGITIDVTLKTVERASGDYEADGYKIGDYVKLIAVDDENDVYVMIAEFLAADTFRYVGPTGMIDGSGTAIKRADKLTIGTTKKSFSMEKKFLDLTNRGINYKGMIVSQMELNVAYGELIGGSFTFQGNGYDAFDAAADAMTFGRTVDAPATTDTLNGSVDMPFLASSDAGDFDATTIDIQKVTLSLNNNLSTQVAIGNIPPKDYSAGTAGVEVSISAYLKDAAWGMLDKKLAQTPFSLSFSVLKEGSGYGFYLPAVQVSFDDPASGGANQDISLEMSGQAKISATGEKALYIYRLVP